MRAGGLAGLRLGGILVMADHMLDTRGLNCPLPVLKAKKAMGPLAAGETLEVLSTDPAAVKDFEAFVRATGHALVERSEENGVFRFLLRKAG
jgi:tRNA 2-thiouridine synthesizing protein A